MFFVSFNRAEASKQSEFFQQLGVDKLLEECYTCQLLRSLWASFVF